MRPNYQIMEQDFVPQEQSLELKELGFDEPCLVGYSTSTEKLEFYSRPYITKDSFTIDAPTFSQAFRFFRDKYGLNAISPTRIYKTDLYQSRIIDWNTWGEIDVALCSSYEDAEIACLKKLIEVVKKFGSFK